MLRHSLDIPPIMFDADELEALILGVKMITAWSGKDLAKSSLSALDKIEAVLPLELKKNLENSKLFVPNFAIPKSHRNNFELLRQAINLKNEVEIDYIKLDNTASTRKLSPLGLYYWGKVWTLVAWCQLRDSFRVFRVDRISQFKLTGKKMSLVDGQSLDDYLVMQQANYQHANQWDENQNYGA